MQEIEFDEKFACSAKDLYKAWLDSKTHGDMVNGTATIDPSIGGVFSIWDGAVEGENLSLDETNLKIEQAWRYEYDDWPADKPSIVRLHITDNPAGGCKLHFKQTHVPPQYVDDIRKGWQDFYWEPMRRYFSN